MDYTVYTAVKNQFTTNPNLCDLFKLLSIETWKRMEYAYLKAGVKVFETTITQNLIFSINAFNDQFSLNIEILEAVDENTNGNDLELVIRYPAKGIEFYAPIQAKKVYRTGRYQSMDRGVQIESLRAYAKTRNAIPFYLLYNFIPLPAHPGHNLGIPPEWNGCTLVAAEYLFDRYYNAKRSKKRGLIWKIPSFYNLHPGHAFCWHEIVCPGEPKELLRKIKTKVDQAEILLPRFLQGLTKAGTTENVPGFFKIGTFNKDDNWKNVRELDFINPESYEKIFDINDPTYNSTIRKQLKGFEEEKESSEFLPKSRLIITRDS